MSGTHVFVLLIILIVFSPALLKMWLSHKDDREVQDSGMDDMLGKIDALEQRIQVLERIITENRFDLKQEIDRL